MDRLNYLSVAATNMLSEEEGYGDFSAHFDDNSQTLPNSQPKGVNNQGDSLEPSLQMGNTQLQTQIQDTDNNGEALDNMKLDEYRQLLRAFAIQNKEEPLQEKVVKALVRKNRIGSRYPSASYFPHDVDSVSASKKPIRYNRDLFEHFFVKLCYGGDNTHSILSSLITRLILSDLNDIFDKSLNLQSSVKRINRGRKSKNGTDITKLAMNWRHILLSANGYLSEKEIAELQTTFESMFNK